MKKGNSRKRTATKRNPRTDYLFKFWGAKNRQEVLMCILCEMLGTLAINSPIMDEVNKAWVRENQEDFYQVLNNGKNLHPVLIAPAAQA